VLPRSAYLVCPLLSVIAAIVFDTWRQVKQDLNDEYDEWVGPLEAETRFELEPARSLLARKGIDSTYVGTSAAGNAVLLSHCHTAV